MRKTRLGLVRVKEVNGKSRDNPEGEESEYLIPGKQQLTAIYVYNYQILFLQFLFDIFHQSQSAIVPIGNCVLSVQ